MIIEKKVLAITLARGGSKRVPKKNITLINNKPLLQYTTDEVKKSKYIDKLILSSDSDRYFRIAKKYGLKNFIKRPKNLSSSKTTSIDSLIYVLRQLKLKGFNYDYCLLLEPTSPLRVVEDIDSSIQKLLKKNKAEALVSLSKVGNVHPQFMYEIKKNNFISRFSKKMKKVTMHSLSKKLYFLDGSIYISKVSSIFSRKSFYHEKTLSYILPKWKSYEVDDLLDFKIIEMIMKSKIHD